MTTLTKTKPVEYLTDHVPEPGDVYEVLPGIQWIRMPLPFQLDHINLWMMEEEDGWVLVDTGINNNRTKEIWRDIFGRLLKGKPLKRLICTHAHPDHLGLGGWLHTEYGAELVITREEWTFGRIVSRGSMATTEFYHQYLRRVGVQEDELDDYSQHLVSTEHLYEEVPARYQRLRDGYSINIGDINWEVIVGLGHAMEHACLYCEKLNVLIAGDQVLPKISPTILVHSHEPKANPLKDFLDSNKKLRRLPDSVTVLPSHNRPFTGLHTRLDQIIAHHDERLEMVRNICEEPLSGFEVAKRLFPQELDQSGKFFATGEAISHIRYLEYEGKLKRTENPDGIECFQCV
ncbi:MAG: MBL fold metallo-hydrolase [Rhodospirillales bacterium]|nr:MBL fold metallo-hydrolase [Rhodospirillales bacterium]